MLSSSAVGARWVLPGSISSIGRSLTLSGFTGTSSIEVTVAPRDGKTRIRLSTDRSQLAGGLFGGIVGGVGGGFGANVGWMIPTLLHLPPVAGLAGAALVVLGAYLLARAIFATHARNLDRRLDTLADRLEAIAQQATERRSLPSTSTLSRPEPPLPGPGGIPLVPASARCAAGAGPTCIAGRCPRMVQPSGSAACSSSRRIPSSGPGSPGSSPSPAAR